MTEHASMRNRSYQCNRQSYMVSRIFTTDIHQRSQTSYTKLCYGVFSHRVQLGGLRVSADHIRKIACKTNTYTIFARGAAFCACLSSRSDCGTYPPDEPRLFWLPEKPKDPQIQSHVGIKMAQVLGSLVYICDIYLDCGTLTTDTSPTQL